MKKYISIFFVFIMCVLIPLNFTSGECYAFKNRKISLTYNQKTFTFYENDLKRDSLFNEIFTPKELFQKISGMGFSKEDIICYVYPKLIDELKKIENQINRAAKNSNVLVESGSPVITAEENGVVLDCENLIGRLFYDLLTKDDDIALNLKVIEVEPQIKKEDNKNLTHEKSFFRTYINGTNQEGRINNIKTSLSKFNGFRLNPKESLSFNEIIGKTTKENGYSPAKVILNGEFVEAFGGGVCQSATTLYNASLIAGLNIKRVSPHSMKVGYVLGSFDAMVSDYSDLVIENPFNTPVFFYTYATDTECGVKIFGEENEYEIKRRNERIEFSEEKFPTISYKSEGYLDYYKDGELVKVERIRSDSYLKNKKEVNSTPLLTCLNKNFLGII